jgi:LEA14-like dessication related protein
MIRKSKICFSFLVPLLVISSCKSFDNIELKGVEKVSFRGIENNTVYFSAGLQVDNPSGASFKIKEVNLKTTADGNYLGTLQCDEDVKIMPRSDSVYMVPLSLKLGNIITGAATLYKLSRQSKVKMEVKGYIRVKSFLATKKVDISRSQVVDVPKIR